MATQVLDATSREPAAVRAGMAALGVLVTIYGSLILIDALVASVGLGNVPFDVGPPMPGNWFPNLLVGLSIAGSGVIATAGARRNLSWAALLGLFLAMGAVYEIVLLDRLYAYQGRPALHAGVSGGSLQDRLDRAYNSGTLRFQTPSYRY